MQKKTVLIATVLIWSGGLCAQAQDTLKETVTGKWFIGSSLWLLGNFIPNDPNPPEYVQLNIGYRLTHRDVVQFRFKRSVYAWPLGIPFGPSFDAPGLNYPGQARILAPQIGYQRFWWKGLHTSLYMLHAFEKYKDKQGKKIGNGFTLYSDLYLGYQFRFLRKRLFFEPAIGVSYWPVRAGVPDSFKAVERNWPNYFIQPGLDFGFSF
ncbi:MAG TPA: hypothetical protein VIK80_06370 [Flavihumibacter sp.]|jgi:hypothetical protein